MTSKFTPSRRGLLAVAPGLALLLAGTAARSGGTMPKANVKYQSHPNGKAQCGNCQYFVPAKSGGPATCKVVAGPVTASAWCSIYAAKAG